MQRVTGTVAISLATVSLLLAGAATATTAAATTGSGKLIPGEADSATAWIRDAQLPNGAIATYPDRRHVRASIGNLAAQGLAERARTSSDNASLEAAWAHLRWYAEAEDADGVVCDYDAAADGRMVATGDEDSTSASAGTFLTAVEAAYDATPPKQRAARLAQVSHGIDGALRAIAAVTRPDGLTYAKPSWHVVYLMRQAETYAGLDSGARLLTILGRADDAKATLQAAQRIVTAVEALWNPQTETYDWAVHESGYRQTTDPAILYPDGIANVWAVAYGLVPDKRAKALMSAIDARFPELRDATSAGYWPQAVTAFREVHQTSQASAVLNGVTARAASTARSWPYTTETAGVSLAVSLAG